MLNSQVSMHTYFFELLNICKFAHDRKNSVYLPKKKRKNSNEIYDFVPCSNLWSCHSCFHMNFLFMHKKFICIQTKRIKMM